MRKTFDSSVGPAVSPESVLQEAADEMLDYKGNDMSVTEISYRFMLFQSIIDEMEAALKTLMNIPNGYEVLFLQGGTSLRLVMMPMNFMRNREADYIVTGYWVKKTHQKAELYGKIRMAASPKDDSFSHIPDCSDSDISPNSDYVYMRESSTIYGTKFHKGPDSRGRILVSDISFRFLSGPINASDCDILSGDIQKNLGPAGPIIAIIRKDLVSGIALSDTPTMLRYKTHTDKGFMYNTPPTYSMYIVDKVIKWIQSFGGLDKMEKTNKSKVALFYDYLDKSDMFCGLADKDSRSPMNITFRIGSGALDSTFVRTAGGNGIISIKDHRAIGGVRANLYNAVPIESAQHLVQFMEAFEKSEEQYE